ncbi:MAG: Spo0E family sporulation regulatory protein-aspartic acid phosphatase [Candidatus Saccharibacteria bacterium]
MTAETQAILQIIEQLRFELEGLVVEKGTRDPGVIGISQKLDALLNEFYRTVGNPAYE